MVETLEKFNLTSRIDLVDGKVFAAGSLEGARNLLRRLISSWSTHAAVALVKETKLIEDAILEVFGPTEKEIQKKAETLPELVSSYNAGFPAFLTKPGWMN